MTIQTVEYCQQLNKGFRAESTGGGCTAIVRDLDNGFFGMITDGDGMIPQLNEPDCVLCLYTPQADTWVTIKSCASARECIDLLAGMG